MFKRRLKALDYLDWDKVNGNDEQHVRKIVVWLEDQKIRHYDEHEREGLRNIASKNWQESFSEYLAELTCPVMSGPRGQLEWLLGLAIRFKFDEEDLVFSENESTQDATKDKIEFTNPLDTLNFESDDFKAGVANIARLLKVTAHPDHLVTLEACSKLICGRLNSSALADPSTVVVKGKPFPIMDTDLGFDMGDRMLNNAGKALSLLYIQDLRNLQTQINEAIVGVQNITANPKTDTKLGKVGI